MRDYERSRVDMIDVVENIFTINNAEWSVKAVFATLVTAFRALRTLIYQLAVIADRDDTGIGMQKADSRLVLIVKGNRFRRALYSYGMAANKLSITGQVDSPVSDLEKLPDFDLVTEMNIYHSLAVANATALVDYGITAGDITAFNTAITDFRDWKADPRTATSQRENAREELYRAVNDAVELLTNRIDPAMYLFETSGTSFYGDYFAGRTIVDPQTQTIALRLHVEDSVTHLPLAGVNIHIPDTGDSRITPESGISEFINLTSGEHIVNFDRPGYVPQVYTVTIVSGVTTDVTIMMVQEG